MRQGQWIGPRVAVVAFLTHLAFIALSFVPGTRAEPLMSGDSPSYAVPAGNILRNGHFSRDPALPFRWEPYRTPAYPLLLAASLAMTGGFALALLAAAGTAGAAAWAAASLLEEWGGGGGGQWGAGLIVALLPNSLGFSASLLTDALFGHLFLVWVWLTWVACKKATARHVIASAVLCVVLQGLKPTFNIAIVFIAAIALASGAQHRSFRVAGVLGLLSMPAPIYFSIRNCRDHGVFAPTLLDAETARHYLQAAALANEEGLTHWEVGTRMARSDHEAAERLAAPASAYGRLYLVRRQAVEEFLRSMPLVAARQMLREAGRQLFAPQEAAFQVFSGDLPWLGRALGSLLTISLWAGAAVGGRLLWLEGRRGPPLLALLILAVYLGAGSVSRYVGARLRFPADLAAAPLAGLGIASMLAGRPQER